MKLFHNIKEYFSFEKKEIKHIFINVVVLGFIFSFTEWGVETFDFRYGLISLFNASLVVLLSLLIRLFVQKVVSISKGYKATYSAWPLGLGLGLLAAVLTNGRAPFFAVPGVIAFSLIERLRVGKPRQWKMLSEEALVSFTGIFTSLLLAFFFKWVSLATSNILIAKLVVVNLWLAVTSVLPIPKLEGFRIFYYSRTLSIFAMVFVIGSAAMLSYLTFGKALLVSGIAGAAIAVTYFIRFELGK
ncbi:hypothetical protein KY316_01695 [Candidatus Woesearchaeota archaeon]|nr:hypothetical protein [Candidatus Woesearchaeota archaeon]